MTSNLQHGLKTRHILMIALGSAIGTGLFLGSAESIQSTGPSILLAYLIGGLIMYIVIRALGEMSVHEPNAGSFSYYAYKYIGNYAGFITGWNYWFLYVIVCMLELTATTMFLDFWFPHAQHWLIILFLIGIFALINLSKVSFFGEFEAWFAFIKVATILVMIVFGAYLIITHSNANSNFNNLWLHNGFFAHGSHGFLLSFVAVVFSFGGTELIGIAAAESQSPQKNIPLAINSIIFRIIIFYIATLFIIMWLFPWNMIDKNLSPFVDVFTKVGVAKAATVMNIVVITAALSSFNSGVYATSRMLFNLGKQNNAPQIFTRLSVKGIPYCAVFFSLACIGFTVILNYLYPQRIFGILLAIATIAAMLNWVAILVTQYAFRQKTKLSDISYKMPFYPFSPIIAIMFFILIIFTMSHMDSMHLAVYIAPIWLIILSIGYWIRTRKIS